MQYISISRPDPYCFQGSLEWGSHAIPPNVCVDHVHVFPLNMEPYQFTVFPYNDVTGNWQRKRLRKRPPPKR